MRAGGGKGKEPEPERGVLEEVLEEVQVVGEAPGRDWMSFPHARHLCLNAPFTPDSGGGTNVAFCATCW